MTNKIKNQTLEYNVNVGDHIVIMKHRHNMYLLTWSSDKGTNYNASVTAALRYDGTWWSETNSTTDIKVQYNLSYPD